MARRVKEANFWVSYSDLATGLMIVFMVVMLLMVVRSKLQTAMQQDRVRDVVESIEIILNTKSKLAESINKALESEQVKADTVTAQVEIADQSLSFELDDDKLKPAGREFLRRVIPPYVCALWMQDLENCTDESGASCGRLDPERPRGVRRILVRGHGSMVGGYGYNQNLSSRRAQTVVAETHRILLRAVEREGGFQLDSDDVWGQVPDACRQDPEALQHYVRERLWAVATGDTEHCTAAVNAAAGQIWCDDLTRAEMNDPTFQKVTFGLEVTGDDMTGLLLDVVALRREVGGDQAQAGEVERIADEVASACWKDPRRYHGCSKYVDECLGEPVGRPSRDLCTGMFLAIGALPEGALARMAADACDAPDAAARLPRCVSLP